MIICLLCYFTVGALLVAYMFSRKAKLRGVSFSTERRGCTVVGALMMVMMWPLSLDLILWD